MTERGAILHLTGMNSAKFGGLERYFLELAAACAKRGRRTVLQYEQEPASREYRAALRRLDVEVISLRTHVGYAEAAARVAQAIRRSRPEVVNTHFVGAPAQLAAAPIARLHGARRVVALLHSVYPMTPLSVRRLALHGYDRVLCVSEQIARGVRAVGVPEARVRTHYLGLFDGPERSPTARRRRRQELGIPPDAVVLGCIAFDGAVKGVDLLIDAMALSGLGAELLVVGVDPALSALPERARQKGVMVHWAGVRERASDLLPAADLYVQPSRMEGIPLAIMEAMAASLPVVATRVGGIPEAVSEGESGLLAEPEPASLAGALTRVLGDRASWERLGRAGRERFVRLFRGEDSVRNLVELHYGLSAEPRRREPVELAAP